MSYYNLCNINENVFVIRDSCQKHRRSQKFKSSGTRISNLYLTLHILNSEILKESNSNHLVILKLFIY